MVLIALRASDNLEHQQQDWGWGKLGGQVQLLALTCNTAGYATLLHKPQLQEGVEGVDDPGAEKVDDLGIQDHGSGGVDDPGVEDPGVDDPEAQDQELGTAAI